MTSLGRIVLVCGLLVGTTSRSQESQGDKDKIQGTWKIVSFDTVPLDKLPSTKVVITADKFEGLGLVLKYKIDPPRKTIDLEGREGDRAIKQPGIYALTGDDLMLYWGADAKSPRPTAFPEGPNKDNHTRLLVLKRASKTQTADAPTGKEEALVMDLIKKYDALPVKARIDKQGEDIIEQLKAIDARLATDKALPRLRLAIARMEARHNLSVLAAAVGDPKLSDIGDGKSTTLPLDPLGVLGPYLTTAPVGTKWEYKVMTESHLVKLGGKDSLTAGLNKMGEESWELVNVERWRFIFKRPVATPAPKTAP
jgi:uncharacterized protein (TIGR03067 family)